MQVRDPKEASSLEIFTCEDENTIISIQFSISYPSVPKICSVITLSGYGPDRVKEGALRNYVTVIEV